MQLPKARTADILEQDVGSEIMIYDLRIDKAYSLNETSKIVYKACGKMSFEELKLQSKFTDDLIYFALDELKKINLIESNYVSLFAGINRREVVRKVGLTSIVALPVILSVIAPSAASAASNPQDNGLTCTRTASTGSTECKSGRCRTTSAFTYNAATGATTFVSSDGLRCCRNSSGSTTGSYSNGGSSGICNFASTCCTGTGAETFDPVNGRYVCTCATTS